MEHFFLLGLGAVWLVYATIHDFKTEEIPNWLTYSLIAFSLGYRAFASFLFGADLFLFGLAGVIFFLIVANILYYTKSFGGGDAKLLMGMGGILPYSSFNDIFVQGLFFLLLLFTVGAVYSILASVFIALNNRKSFVIAYKNLMKKYKLVLLVVLGALIALEIFSIYSRMQYLFFLILGLIILIPLIISITAVDKCMVKRKDYRNLQEGDWIVEKIKAGKKWIIPNVHGLSAKEIGLLKKYRKSPLVRGGVPFAVSFLLAFMLYAYLTSIYFFEPASVFELLAFLAGQ